MIKNCKKHPQNKGALEYITITGLFLLCWASFTVFSCDGI